MAKVRYKQIGFMLFIAFFLWIPTVEAETTVTKEPLTQVDATIEYLPEGRPSGIVQSSSPNITYYIKLSSYDLPYEITMYLNGREVNADYNEDTGIVSYQASGLSGENTVEVTLSTYGKEDLSRSWSFEVDKRTIIPLAGKDMSLLERVQNNALKRANEYRSVIGVPPLTSNETLQEAAQAHANYIEVNETGHTEVSTNETLFTGRTPQDRSAYFGYGSYFVGEGITYEEPGGPTSIDHLYDAPYHRLSLMNPFYTEAGTGYNGDGDLVINFGGLGHQGESKVVLYPYEGQEQAKVSWLAFEEPNPLRFFGENKIWTGYPISFAYFGGKSDRLVVQSSSLVDSSGQQVSTYTVTPEMEDQGKHHLFLIPKEFLKPGETYQVEVDAYIEKKSGSTKDVSRTWNFKTADKIALDRVYFEKHNGTNFLTLEWASGKDPNTVITLEMNGERYLRKEGKQQTTYKELTSGLYTMSIDSPHFNEVKTYQIMIQSKEDLYFDYDSPLNVTKVFEDGMMMEDTDEAGGNETPIFANYQEWDVNQSSFSNDKVWNIRFNSSMLPSQVNNSNIYVVNNQNEKVDVNLMLERDGTEIVVTPPSGNYSSGDYTLVIQPLKNKADKIMDNGIQMPFKVQ